MVDWKCIGVSTAPLLASCIKTLNAKSTALWEPAKSSNPVEIEGGKKEREKVRETGMGYVYILKCEILRKGTVENKTLYVWTSVGWGPERDREGKCFLSLLILLFSCSSSHLFLHFYPLLKLVQWKQGLNGMSWHRSLMANHYRLEQWWPKTVWGPNSAIGSKGSGALGIFSGNKDRPFCLRNRQRYAVYLHSSYLKLAWPCS